MYDKSLPEIPFSALKTEYKKEFGKTYNLRSRSVPKKLSGALNATTRELIEALHDDDGDVVAVSTGRQEKQKLNFL